MCLGASERGKKDLPAGMELQIALPFYSAGYKYAKKAGYLKRNRQEKGCPGADS